MSALDEIEDIQFCDNNAHEAAEAKREVLRIVSALTQQKEKAEAERDVLKEERNKIAKHIRVTLDDGTAPDNLADHVLFVMIHEYDPMVKRIQRLEKELAEARNKA